MLLYWSYTLNALSYCRVWLMKCCKNKNSYVKIYFHSIKTALYLIKYISIYHLVFHDIKRYFHSVRINLYSVRNFYHINFCFIQVKYVFIIEIFRWILFWWGYLLFLLHFLRITTARECEKAVKVDIRVWCYES